MKMYQGYIQSAQSIFYSVTLIPKILNKCNRINNVMIYYKEGRFNKLRITFEKHELYFCNIFYYI